MKIINTPNENRIAIEFFREYCFITDISRKLYPHYFKQNKPEEEITKKLKKEKRKTVGAVSTPANRWGKLEYMNTKLKPKPKENAYKKWFTDLPAIRLNLNPLFEIFEENNVSLNKSEQSKLNKFLDNQEIRNFVIDWNTNKNKESFQENIYETLSIFIRSLGWYSKEDILISALGEEDYNKNSKKCLEIENLIKIFIVEVEKDIEKKDYLFSKLDNGFKYFPALIKQEDYKCF